MLNWLHKLLNPHCPDCKLDSQDEMICPSCEILKEEINFLRAENRKLIDSITAKPEAEPERLKAPVPVTVPKVLPWSIKRQMLEQQDREKAMAARKAAKPDMNIEDLEKEMKIIAEERGEVNGN